MTQDNTGANKDWQQWLVEQGLADTPSASDAASTSPQPAQAEQQATTPATPIQPAANGQVGAAQQTQGAAQAQPPYGTAATSQLAGQHAQQAQAAPTAALGTQTPAAAYDAAAARQTAKQAKAQQKAAKKAAKKASKSNKSGGGFRTFALGFLGAALAFTMGMGFLGAKGYIGQQPQLTETVSEGGTVVLGSDTNTTIAASEVHSESLAEAVADKVLPSVVGIDVYANASSYGYGSFWGGGSTDTETLAGLGSGVIISKDGYILTNYHVVEGASKLMVTAGGEELEASVVGTDESSDLAVIKIDANVELAPVEIGSSENLKPGQWVMTLGSPFGLEQSVATGIISATSRTVVIQDSSIYSYGQQVQPSIYSNMIQTDAAINPGNSGGALVDENGKLIGINSVIESYSGSYSGVGFAIPVDYAMNIAAQIIDGKTPTHAQLGVSATTVDRDIAERYSLGTNAGAYVNKVYDDSGAQAAGMEQGDIITKINGVAVESSTDLIGQVRAHNVGETVTVTIVRGAETQELEVTLGSDEETASYVEELQQQNNGSYHNWGDGSGNGQDGNGFNFDFGWGQDEDGNGQDFSYEDLEELFNYLYNN